VTDPALFINHDALPPSAELFGSSNHGLACDGKLIGNAASYQILADPSTGSRGGDVSILRLRGKPSIEASAPAERFRAGTIAGHPAVIVEPILADVGLGTSFVMVYADGVLTTIQAGNLPLDMVIQIAEAQFR
jgi:hypothetical protein